MKFTELAYGYSGCTSGNCHSGPWWSVIIIAAAVIGTLVYRWWRKRGS
jgi:hypothetical protein